MDLPLDLQNKIAARVDTIYSRYQNTLTEVFYSLRNSISYRKLFVMFEDLLLCNVYSDHLVPKSVLPVFYAFISAAEEDLRKISYAHLHQGMADFQKDLLRKEVEQRYKLSERLYDVSMRYYKELSINLQATANFEYLSTNQYKLQQKLLYIQQYKRENSISQYRFGDVFKADAQIGALEVGKKMTQEERIMSMYTQVESLKFKLGKAERALVAYSAYNSYIVSNLAGDVEKMQLRIEELEKQLSARQEASTADDMQMRPVVNESMEMSDFEDAKKVIRHLKECLYDKDLLCYKLAEKLLVKDRLIKLSADVANYFGRISGVANCTQQNNQVYNNEDYTEEYRMKQQFTYLARLYLQLKEVYNQNCELRVSLKDYYNINQKIFTEAVLEPSFAADSYNQFIYGNDDISQLVIGTLRGSRSIESIIQYSVLEEKREKSLNEEGYLASKDSVGYQQLVRDATRIAEDNSLLKTQLMRLTEGKRLLSYNNSRKEEDGKQEDLPYIGAYGVTTTLQDKNTFLYHLNNAEKLPNVQLIAEGDYEECYSLALYLNGDMQYHNLNYCIYTKSIATQCSFVYESERQKCPAPVILPLNYPYQHNASLKMSDGSYIEVSYQTSSGPLSKDSCTDPSYLMSFSLYDTTPDRQTPYNVAFIVANGYHSNFPAVSAYMSLNTDNADAADDSVLFMLNEDLMCTIEFGDERCDELLDRQLGLLCTQEKTDDEVGMSRTLLYETPTRMWQQRFFRLLYAMKRLRYKLAHTISGSAIAKYFAEMESASGHVDTSHKSSCGSNIILGELVISNSYYENIINKYRSVALPDGMVVIMTGSNVLEEDIIYIRGYSAAIGADLLLNPNVYDLLSVIRKYTNDYTISSDRFYTADEAFDWLACNVTASRVAYTGYTDNASCLNGDNMVEKSYSEYHCDDRLYASYHTLYEMPHKRPYIAPSDYQNVFDFEGRKLEASTVEDILGYIYSILAVDLSCSREQVRNYLVQSLNNLIYQYEAVTSTHGANMNYLRMKLNRVTQAQYEFYKLITEVRSIGVQTGGNWTAETEYQRCQLACKKLSVKYPEINLPDHLSYAEDVYNRLYNYAKRLQRQIEYAENKYVQAYMRTYNIISMELRIKPPQDRIVKPPLVRPDGRDYNTRGKILYAASRAMNHGSKGLQIAVKPLK